MSYTLDDIRAAHQQAIQRQSELRRQVLEITGVTPLVLPKGVITLEAEIVEGSKLQRRYHLISTGAYRAGKAWKQARYHAARVDEIIRFYHKLPDDATPRTCPQCGDVLARPNRAAKFCSTACQRLASGKAGQARRKSA